MLDFLAFVLPSLFPITLGLLVLSVFGAFFLMLAVRGLAGFWPGYPRAWLVTLGGYLGALAIGFLVWFAVYYTAYALYWGRARADTIMQFLAIPLGLILLLGQAWLAHRAFRPEGVVALGLGRAVVAQLAHLVMAAALVMAVGLIGALFFS